MKALRILKGNRLELVNRGSVALAPWEVRISVAISLVCGSDIKSIRLSSSEDRIPGHEFAGIITEVSNQAREILNVGDRVTAFPMMPCHSCFNCKKRNYRDCEFKESLGGDVWPGSFATELIIDSRMAIVLPRELSMEQGAMLEHLCCAYRFAKEAIESSFHVDSQILIIGDGPIAIGNLQMLLLEGYKNISILGKHRNRLRFAEELGAHNVFHIDELGDRGNIYQQKFDICVLSAPSEAMILDLSKAFSYGARIVEQTRFLDENLKQLLVSCGFVFKRAFAYHLSDFTEVAHLVITGTIKTDRLVTNRFSLETFGSGYPDVLAKHNNMKVAIICDETLFDSQNWIKN